MTERVDTTVHHVAIRFDGTEGMAGRAEIVETSAIGATERTFELVLCGLPEEIERQALAALGIRRTVQVRVLDFYGPWIVTDTAPHGDARAFRLESAGYIMGTAPSRHIAEE